MIQSPHEMHNILTADALHEKAMQIGSANLLKAIYVTKVGMGPAPSRAFLWSRMGLVPRADGPAMERDHIAAARMHYRKDQQEALKAHCEPCFMCGTRSDIGCKHLRAA